MQSVLAKIEELAVGYDGTNSTGMLQLWFFVQTGYSYHRWFSSETGVGSFDAATDRAYLAASDAFAASDHFYAPNDEAAQILYYYFEAAFAAGLRRNHLAPIKKVLSGFTPERAGGETWDPQPAAFITVLRRVHGAFENQDEGLTLHQNFMDALAQDPEFVEVMLQVTRYDFFLFLEESDSFTYRLRLLETAIKILVRFTHLDSLKEAAISALISILFEHPRLSSPFLAVARALENQVDCASLNICRDVLEREILAQALPKTYSFDDGAIVFKTPLDLEEKKVQLWYYAFKQVQAQFHRLVETDEVVDDEGDVLTARIYGTKLDYTIFEAYLSYADTRGIKSGGFYSGGILRTWVRNQPGDRVTYSGGSFEEVIRHEYAHYLADRFGLHGGPWFDEGLAEFLVGSTQAEGTPVRSTQVRYIASDELRLDTARLFNSRYSGDLGGGHFYYYADLLFHFMYQQRRTQLLELFDLLRSGDHTAYRARVRTWAADRQLAADFDAFLDEQIANLDQLVNPVISYIHPSFLTSDSAEEIESVLQRINGDLNLGCRIAATEPYPRFGCAGTLSAGSEFSENGDRGSINEYLNTQLDSFIAAAVEDGAINNFENMNCYFANVAGSPSVADLYCEGPLRPANLAQVRVDLKTTLVNYSDDPKAYEEKLLRLLTTLDFSEEVASNVTLTWSASLPVRLRPGWCKVVESTEQAGTIACGHIYNESEAGLPLELTLNIIPLQAGSLDFSVEFSSDEPEIEPADNVASLQLTISRTSHHIATLEGHRAWVFSVAFSPDGTMLAAGTGDYTVKLWDVATATNTATLRGHGYPVKSVAFSPDGTMLAAAAGDHQTVKLWDVATATNIATLEGHTGVVNSVAFSPDGTILASGADDNTVKLWDVATATNIATLEGHTGAVNSVAFSPDGTILASGASYDTVKLWDVATATNITTFEGQGSTRSMAFSPDGMRLAAAAGDNTIKLWDVATATNINILSGHEFPAHSVAFSPDGMILASGTADKTVKLWDVATATNITTFEGHTHWVNSVVFSPDGTMLASGSFDKTVQLWNVSKWKHPLNGELAFGFARAVEDQAYTAGTTITALQLPEATGGEGEITYRVSDLPAGLTFDAATRTISGTPEAATDGVVEVTYTAQDSTGAAATLTFSITVNPSLSFGDLFGLLNSGASEKPPVKTPSADPALHPRESSLH